MWEFAKVLLLMMLFTQLRYMNDNLKAVTADGSHGQPSTLRVTEECTK